MRGRAPAWVLLVLLVPAAATTLPGAGPLGSAAAEPLVPGIAYPWWDTAWHLRVPVLVEPRAADPFGGEPIDLAPLRLSGYPATVEIDFSQAVRETGEPGRGWPQDAQGRLASFTFDPDSVRVVEQERARFNGCILLRDRVSGEPRCLQPGDRPHDAVLAATLSPGLWANPEGKTPSYHPSQNAVATLQWIIPGEFTQARLFFVYFDVLENGAKEPHRPRVQDQGPVRGLNFVRWGTDILGYAPGTKAAGAGVLLAQALYDNTTVAISKYVARGVEPAETARATLHAIDGAQPSESDTCRYLALDYQGTLCLEVPMGESFFFRVRANRPVVVGLSNQHRVPFAGTLYPSRDGGLAGTDFAFRALSGGELEIVSVSGSFTQVTVDNLQDGSRFPRFLDGSSSVRVPSAAGSVFRVTSNRAVMVMAASPGAAFVDPQGGTAGSSLLGIVADDLGLVNLGEGAAEILRGAPLARPDDPAAFGSFGVEPGAAEAYRTGGCGGCFASLWRIDAREGAVLAGKAGDDGLLPLGGLDAQRFELSLRPKPNSALDASQARLLLKPLYDNTRIVVTNATSGRVHVNTTLGLHDWLDRTDAGAPVVGLGDWSIEASKPVAAFWLGLRRTAAGELPFAAYYPAKAAPPLQEVGEAEFHGYAVGWEERLRTMALAPGERGRVKLTLVNLGRGPGGSPLADDIAIGAPRLTAPPNATPPEVTVSSALEAAVPSFGKRDLTLSLDVPADAPTGAVYQVNLTARSRGNPLFEDTARVVVTVQIRYDFSLRFVETDGATLQRIMNAGAATCADVELKNTGTGDARVGFQMTPTRAADTAFGFDPRLLPRVQGACDPGTLAELVGEDGRATREVALARGEAVPLTLYVKAPAGTQPLPLELEIQGTAAQDASVRRQLSATFFTNVEAKLRFTALDERATVLPGQAAGYRVLVENVGDVETPVLYGTGGLLPAGWNVTFDGAPSVLRGRGSVDALGRSLDRAEFVVNVTAAPGAPVALVVPVSLVATSAILIDTGESSKAFRQSDDAKVTAVVGNNFTLGQPENLPLTVSPGEPFALDFEVRNAANGNFSLRVAQGALPRNWTLVVVEPANATPLRQGESSRVRVNVTPEVATKAGAYELGLVFLTRDAFTQGAGFRNYTLLVRSTVEFRVVPEADDLVLAPGSQREVAVLATNTGNLPVELRLAAAAPPGYGASIVGASKLALPPGESLRTTLLLRAPDQPSEAPQALRLTATDDTSGKQRAVEVRVRTARLDLVVTEAAMPSRDLRPGDPAVVLATVQNRGTVPANGVAIALLVNGKGVRNETIRSLPPGEPRTIALPWTVNEVPTSAVVVIDPDDAFAESDEANNQATVPLAATPGFGAPAAALALALGLAGLRARSKGRRPGAGGGHG